jgi:hypothetical protein
MNQEILSSSGVSEGTWIQVDNLLVPYTIAIFGFAGNDKAQIYVSNSYAKPAAVAPVAGDGTLKLGSDISADGYVSITTPFRWLRVRKSAADASPATTVAQIQGIT